MTEAKGMVNGGLRRIGIVVAIGKVTFQEILRDKILYSGLIVAVMLIAIAALGSELTFIASYRVVLDFGLFAVWAVTAVIGGIFGATIIQREFDRRTVYVALSHPISRAEFVWGKFTGLGLLLALNWLLLSGLFMLVFYLSAGSMLSFEQTFHPTTFAALILYLGQAMMLSAFSILLSSFSTPSVSVMILVGFFMVGNAISQIRMMALKSQNPLVSALLDAIARFAPDFESFNLGTKVTYGILVSWGYVGQALLYAAGWIVVSLLAAGFLIRSKEV